MTCRDFLSPGWRYHVGNPNASSLVLHGNKLPVSEISGVLTRLPYVWVEELPEIVPTDRAYVASEICAFLLCWLSELNCPVLNRPRPGCLTGPCLRPEQWVATASRLGMRVRPVRREADGSIARQVDSTEDGSVTVNVIGDRILGSADEALNIQARQLAEALDVALLGVRFSSPEADAAFLEATLCPDLDDDCTASEIIRYFKCCDNLSLRGRRINKPTSSNTHRWL